MTSRGTKYWNSGAIPLIAPELLGDIIAMASDLSVVISPEGRVLSVLVNPNNRQFIVANHWKDRDIRDCLTVESVPKLELKLETLAKGGDSMDTVELNHSERSGWEFPISYSFHRIGPDGSLLMLGRDLRPIAEMQQQLVKAQLALEADYEAQREFDTRFRVLMDTTQDAMIFVALSSGRITEVNAAAAELLGARTADLAGAAFAQEFDGRRRGEFMETLTNVALADGGGQPLELIARRNRKRLSVAPRVFRASGERLLICRLEPAETPDVVADELTDNLSGLYQEGVDAIVFADLQGTVLAANEAFLSLVDAAHSASVKGKSLAQFLTRGTVDLKVLVENAARAGQMRMYATRLLTEFGGETSVEISATYLSDRAHPVIVFVMRDASRADAMRKPGTDVSDEGVRSVMEMVGSATLKEIVTKTTDVVERMCIETADELTQHNRVATAEMLGLSRQSLYVKLRKYGLLDKNADS